MGTIDALAQAASPDAPKEKQPGAAAGYQIAGTVVNANTEEPIGRATVTLISESNDHAAASVETDSEGRFIFKGLAAAKYPLTASKRGFLTAFYDQHDGGYNTAIVTGEGQQTTGLVFKLVTGAVLYGVVTGDGGDAVEGARVMLFAKPTGHNPGARITQAGETATDDTGAYEFDNLAAGEYLLAVKATPWYAVTRMTGGGQRSTVNDGAVALDVAYPLTFFDSTTDEGSASSIILTGGARDEADINLHAVPALHLLVPAAEKQDGSLASPRLQEQIWGTPLDPGGEGGHGIFQGTDANLMEFTGMAPGVYELTQGDPPRVAELDLTANQQLDPGLGTQTVTVAGNLRMNPALVLPENPRVALVPLDDTNGKAPMQTTSAKGAFTFAAVIPGDWRLVAGTPGKTLAISSISVNRETQAGNRFAVKDKPVQIEADVSMGDSQIEGFAKEDRKGVAGAMIVLVPANPVTDSDQFRRDQSDSDGSFSLQNVAPGKYTVVAIKDGWDLDWAQPEVIGRYLPKGVSVRVAESSQKQVRLSEAVPVQGRR